ncbi:hypothetical protein BVX98_03345 [bacterium F11]|nr:hypothetical protein BVX98_03345 [bacterium F11]
MLAFLFWGIPWVVLSIFIPIRLWTAYWFIKKHRPENQSTAFALVGLETWAAFFIYLNFSPWFLLGIILIHPLVNWAGWFLVSFQIEQDRNQRWPHYSKFKNILNEKLRNPIKSAEVKDRYGIPDRDKLETNLEPDFTDIPTGHTASGMGLYRNSIIFYLDPDREMDERINRVKRRLVQTKAFRNGKIQFVPNRAIHHTLKEYPQQWVDEPVPAATVRANYEHAVRQVSGHRGFYAEMDGFGYSAQKRFVLNGVFTPGFNELEEGVRTSRDDDPMSFARIEFVFGVAVEEFEDEENEEIQTIIDEEGSIPLGRKYVDHVDFCHHQDDMLSNPLRRVAIRLNSIPPIIEWVLRVVAWIIEFGTMRHVLLNFQPADPTLRYNPVLRDSWGTAVDIPILNRFQTGTRREIFADETHTFVNEVIVDDDKAVRELIKNNTEHIPSINKAAEEEVGRLVKVAYREFKTTRAHYNDNKASLEEYERAWGKFVTLTQGGYDIYLNSPGLSDVYHVPEVTEEGWGELVAHDKLIGEFFYALSEFRKSRGWSDNDLVQVNVITRASETRSLAFFHRPEIINTLSQMGIQIKVIATKVNRTGIEINDFEVIHAPVVKDGIFVFPRDHGEIFFGDNKERKEFGKYENEFINVQAIGPKGEMEGRPLIESHCGSGYRNTVIFQSELSAEDEAEFEYSYELGIENPSYERIRDAVTGDYIDKFRYRYLFDLNQTREQQAAEEKVVPVVRQTESHIEIYFETELRTIRILVSPAGRVDISMDIRWELLNQRAGEDEFGNYLSFQNFYQIRSESPFLFFRMTYQLIANLTEILEIEHRTENEFLDRHPMEIVLDEPVSAISAQNSTLRVSIPPDVVQSGPRESSFSPTGSLYVVIRNNRQGLGWVQEVVPARWDEQGGVQFVFIGYQGQLEVMEVLHFDQTDPVPWELQFHPTIQDQGRLPDLKEIDGGEKLTNPLVSRVEASPMTRGSGVDARVFWSKRGIDKTYSEMIIMGRLLPNQDQVNLDTPGSFERIEGFGRFKRAEVEQNASAQFGAPTPMDTDEMFDDLYGNEDRIVRSFVRSAQLAKLIGFKEINVNMCCPARNVHLLGGGIGLLKNPGMARAIIVAIKKETGLAVSAKMLLIPQEGEPSQPDMESSVEFAKSLDAAGLDSLVVQAQVAGSEGTYPEAVARIGEEVKMPVVHSGKVGFLYRSPEDVENVSLFAVDELLKSFLDNAKVMMGRALFGPLGLWEKPQLTDLEVLEEAYQHVQAMRGAFHGMGRAGVNMALLQVRFYTKYLSDDLRTRLDHQTTHASSLDEIVTSISNARDSISGNDSFGAEAYPPEVEQLYYAAATLLGFLVAHHYMANGVSLWVSLGAGLWFGVVLLLLLLPFFLFTHYYRIVKKHPEDFQNSDGSLNLSAISSYFAYLIASHLGLGMATLGGTSLVLILGLISIPTSWVPGITFHVLSVMAFVVGQSLGYGIHVRLKNIEKFRWSRRKRGESESDKASGMIWVRGDNPPKVELIFEDRESVESRARGLSEIVFTTGSPDDTGVIKIGRDVRLNDAFVSFRTSKGGVDDLGTTIIPEMTIGNEAEISGHSEVINTNVGEGSRIRRLSVLVEADGMGSHSELTDASDAKLCFIGDNSLVREGSKVFKAILGNHVTVGGGSALIGGPDETYPGWRSSERGVVLKDYSTFLNGVAHHFGTKTGEINPIVVEKGISLDGVYLLSYQNEPVRAEVDFVLPLGKRVTITDNITLDANLKKEIEAYLPHFNHVVVEYVNGKSYIYGTHQNLERFSLDDFISLKDNLRAEWTSSERIEKIFAVNSVGEAVTLNSFLSRQRVYIDSNGRLLTKEPGSLDYREIDVENRRLIGTVSHPQIRATLGQGVEVYPGLQVFAHPERSVVINLMQIGQRGGAVVVADGINVHMGPELESGKVTARGRVSGAAVVRDVNLKAEFNNFGGVANQIQGDAKLTLRSGLLEKAFLKFTSFSERNGEVIWGWMIGRQIHFSVGDNNIALTHGGMIEGGELPDGTFSVKLTGSFRGPYQMVLLDLRDGPTYIKWFDNHGQPAMHDGTRVEVGSIDPNPIHLWPAGTTWEDLPAVDRQLFDRFSRQFSVNDLEDSLRDLVDQNDEIGYLDGSRAFPLVADIMRCIQLLRTGGGSSRKTVKPQPHDPLSQSERLIISIGRKLELVLSLPEVQRIIRDPFWNENDTGVEFGILVALSEYVFDFRRPEAQHSRFDEWKKSDWHFRELIRIIRDESRRSRAYSNAARQSTNANSLGAEAFPPVVEQLYYAAATLLGFLVAHHYMANGVSLWVSLGAGLWFGIVFLVCLLPIFLLTHYVRVIRKNPPTFRHLDGSRNWRNIFGYLSYLTARHLEFGSLTLGFAVPMMVLGLPIMGAESFDGLLPLFLAAGPFVLGQIAGYQFHVNVNTSEHYRWSGPSDRKIAERLIRVINESPVEARETHEYLHYFVRLMEQNGQQAAEILALMFDRDRRATRDYLERILHIAEMTDSQEEGIVLGSTSPHRKRILELMLPGDRGFDVAKPDMEEFLPTQASYESAMMALAFQKAWAVAKTNKGTVIGSDTTVLVDGTPVGKIPKEENAFEVLKQRSGQNLEVVSSVAVIDTKEGRVSFGFDNATVEIKPFDEKLSSNDLSVLAHLSETPGYHHLRDLQGKAASGKPVTVGDVCRLYTSLGRHQGKAGGFGVQDRDFFLVVRKVRKNPMAIVGLPSDSLRAIFSGMGIKTKDPQAMDAIKEELWPHALEQEKFEPYTLEKTKRSASRIHQTITPPDWPPLGYPRDKAGTNVDIPLDSKFSGTPRVLFADEMALVPYDVSQMTTDAWQEIMPGDPIKAEFLFALEELRERKGWDETDPIYLVVLTEGQERENRAFFERREVKDIFGLFGIQIKVIASSVESKGPHVEYFGGRKDPDAKRDVWVFPDEGEIMIGSNKEIPEFGDLPPDQFVNVQALLEGRHGPDTRRAKRALGVVQGPLVDSYQIELANSIEWSEEFKNYFEEGSFRDLIREQFRYFSGPVFVFVLVMGILSLAFPGLFTGIVIGIPVGLGLMVALLSGKFSDGEVTRESWFVWEHRRFFGRANKIAKNFGELDGALNYRVWLQQKYAFFKYTTVLLASFFFPLIHGVFSLYLGWWSQVLVSLLLAVGTAELIVILIHNTINSLKKDDGTYRFRWKGALPASGKPQNEKPRADLGSILAGKLQTDLLKAEFDFSGKNGPLIRQVTGVLLVGGVGSLFLHSLIQAGAIEAFVPFLAPLFLLIGAILIILMEMKHWVPSLAWLGVPSAFSESDSGHDERVTLMTSTAKMPHQSTGEEEFDEKKARERLFGKRIDKWLQDHQKKGNRAEMVATAADINRDSLFWEGLGSQTDFGVYFIKYAMRKNLNLETKNLRNFLDVLRTAASKGNKKRVPHISVPIKTFVQIRVALKHPRVESFLNGETLEDLFPDRFPNKLLWKYRKKNISQIDSDDRMAVLMDLWEALEIQVDSDHMGHVQTALPDRLAPGLLKKDFQYISVPRDTYKQVRGAVYNSDVQLYLKGEKSFSHAELGLPVFARLEGKMFADIDVEDRLGVLMDLWEALDISIASDNMRQVHKALPRKLCPGLRKEDILQVNLPRKTYTKVRGAVYHPDVQRYLSGQKAFSHDELPLPVFDALEGKKIVHVDKEDRLGVIMDLWEALNISVGSDNMNQIHTALPKELAPGLPKKDINRVDLPRKTYKLVRAAIYHPAVQQYLRGQKPFLHNDLQLPIFKVLDGQRFTQFDTEDRLGVLMDLWEALDIQVDSVNLGNVHTALPKELAPGVLKEGIRRVDLTRETYKQVRDAVYHPEVQLYLRGEKTFSYRDLRRPAFKALEGKKISQVDKEDRLGVLMDLWEALGIRVDCDNMEYVHTGLPRELAPGLLKKSIQKVKFSRRTYQQVRDAIYDPRVQLYLKGKKAFSSADLKLASFKNREGQTISDVDYEDLLGVLMDLWEALDIRVDSDNMNHVYMALPRELAPGLLKVGIQAVQLPRRIYRGIREAVDNPQVQLYLSGEKPFSATNLKLPVFHQFNGKKFTEIDGEEQMGVLLDLWKALGIPVDTEQMKQVYSALPRELAPGLFKENIHCVMVSRQIYQQVRDAVSNKEVQPYLRGEVPFSHTKLNLPVFRRWNGKKMADVDPEDRLEILMDLWKALGIPVDAESMAYVHSALPRELAPGLLRKEIINVNLPRPVYQQVRAAIRHPQVRPYLEDKRAFSKNTLSLPLFDRLEGKKISEIDKEDRLVVLMDLWKALDIRVDSENMGNIHTAFPRELAPGLFKKDIYRLDLSRSVFDQIRGAVFDDEVQLYLKGNKAFSHDELKLAVFQELEGQKITALDPEDRLGVLMDLWDALGLQIDSESMADVHTALPKELAPHFLREDIIFVALGRGIYRNLRKLLKKKSVEKPLLSFVSGRVTKVDVAKKVIELASKNKVNLKSAKPEQIATGLPKRFKPSSARRQNSAAAVTVVGVLALIGFHLVFGLPAFSEHLSEMELILNSFGPVSSPLSGPQTTALAELGSVLAVSMGGFDEKEIRKDLFGEGIDEWLGDHQRSGTREELLGTAADLKRDTFFWDGLTPQTDFGIHLVRHAVNKRIHLETKSLGKFTAELRNAVPTAKKGKVPKINVSVSAFVGIQVALRHPVVIQFLTGSRLTDLLPNRILKGFLKKYEYMKIKEIDIEDRLGVLMELWEVLRISIDCDNMGNVYTALPRELAPGFLKKDLQRVDMNRDTFKQIRNAIDDLKIQPYLRGEKAFSSSDLDLPDFQALEGKRITDADIDPEDRLGILMDLWEALKIRVDTDNMSQVHTALPRELAPGLLKKDIRLVKLSRSTYKKVRRAVYHPEVQSYLKGEKTFDPTELDLPVFAALKGQRYTDVDKEDRLGVLLDLWEALNIKVVSQNMGHIYSALPRELVPGLLRKDIYRVDLPRKTFQEVRDAVYHEKVQPYLRGQKAFSDDELKLPVFKALKGKKITDADIDSEDRLGILMDLWEALEIPVSSDNMSRIHTALPRELSPNLPKEDVQYVGLPRRTYKQVRDAVYHDQVQPYLKGEKAFSHTELKLPVFKVLDGKRITDDDVDPEDRLGVLMDLWDALGIQVDSENMGQVYSALPKELAPGLLRRDFKQVNLPLPVYKQVRAAVYDERVQSYFGGAQPFSAAELLLPEFEEFDGRFISAIDVEDRLGVLMDLWEALEIRVDTEDMRHVYAALPREVAPGLLKEDIQLVNIARPAYKQVRAGIKDPQVQAYLSGAKSFSSSELLLPVFEDLEGKRILEVDREDRLGVIMDLWEALGIRVDSQNMVQIHNSLPRELAPGLLRSDIHRVDLPKQTYKQVRDAVYDKKIQPYLRGEETFSHATLRLPVFKALEGKRMKDVDAEDRLGLLMDLWEAFGVRVDSGNMAHVHTALPSELAPGLKRSDIHHVDLPRRYYKQVRDAVYHEEVQPYLQGEKTFSSEELPPSVFKVLEGKKITDVDSHDRLGVLMDLWEGLGIRVEPKNMAQIHSALPKTLAPGLMKKSIFRVHLPRLTYKQVRDAVYHDKVQPYLTGRKVFLHADLPRPVFEDYNDKAISEVDAEDRLGLLMDLWEVLKIPVDSDNMTHIHSALPNELAPGLTRESIYQVNLPRRSYRELRAFLKQKSILDILMPMVALKATKKEIAQEVIPLARQHGVFLKSASAKKVAQALPKMFDSSQAVPQSAFTLIEVLGVLAIIGLGLGFGLPVLQRHLLEINMFLTIFGHLYWESLSSSVPLLINFLMLEVVGILMLGMWKKTEAIVQVMDPSDEDVLGRVARLKRRKGFKILVVGAGVDIALSSDPDVMLIRNTRADIALLKDAFQSRKMAIKRVRLYVDSKVYPKFNQSALDSYLNDLKFQGISVFAYIKMKLLPPIPRVLYDYYNDLPSRFARLKLVLQQA